MLTMKIVSLPNEMRKNENKHVICSKWTCKSI